MAIQNPAPETGLYVFVNPSSSNFDCIELEAPFRDSIDELLDEIEDGKPWFHVSLSLADETTIYMFLYQLEKELFNGQYPHICHTYKRTLAEQGIDIRNELRVASRMQTDDEALTHLRQFNLLLRVHMENYPKHYNNPVRLPRQGGKLRKPRTFPPLDIRWG